MSVSTEEKLGYTQKDVIPFGKLNFTLKTLQSPDPHSCVDLKFNKLYIYIYIWDKESRTIKTTEKMRVLVCVSVCMEGGGGAFVLSGL